MTSAPRPTPLALTVLALLHYEPLHPYGLQRLIRQWGKDAVINVEQRASLYRTIERLEAAGLITVRETGRDQQYPERTVYELTDEGRATARAWLADMLATPKNEYPEFPAALSHLLLFSADDIAQALETRAAALAARLSSLEEGIRNQAAAGLPRIAGLEDEYLRAVLKAELDWVRATAAEMRDGRLSWNADELREFALRQG
ncbi:PadR family transcriptional regulator [Diaminobutyricibacter sp. McL0618]|uniref:PadR family transcriptional regulator n=1 Tax=Leifsonia sp. McL0618 TaxID=3415677 RepID=UPI003CF6FEEC